MQEVNYIAVVLMTVLAFALSALWYSPVLFGNTWMKIMGADKYSKEEIANMQKQMMPMYALQFVITLITMYVLSALVHFVNMDKSVWMAFFMWLGFVMPTQVSSVIWGSTDRKWWCKQIAIMSMSSLVVMIIAGLVFSRY